MKRLDLLQLLGIGVPALVVAQQLPTPTPTPANATFTTSCITGSAMYVDPAWDRWGELIGVDRRGRSDDEFRAAMVEAMTRKPYV